MAIDFQHSEHPRVKERAAAGPPRQRDARVGWNGRIAVGLTGATAAVFDTLVVAPQTARRSFATLREYAAPAGSVGTSLVVGDATGDGRADVVFAAPVYLTQAAWRHPITGERRAIQLVGFDTETGAIDFGTLEGEVQLAEQNGHGHADSREQKK